MQTRVHIHMRTAKLLHDQLEREKKKIKWEDERHLFCLALPQKAKRWPESRRRKIKHITLHERLRNCAIHNHPLQRRTQKITNFFLCFDCIVWKLAFVFSFYKEKSHFFRQLRKDPLYCFMAVLTTQLVLIQPLNSGNKSLMSFKKRTTSPFLMWLTRYILLTAIKVSIKWQCSFSAISFDYCSKSVCGNWR